MKEIPLTQGKVALVDDDDYERLSVFSWYAYKSKAGVWYARSSANVGGERETMRMHRVVLGAKPGQIVDHKNGNGLDNQKSNLRFCTHSQNQQNRKVPRSRLGVKGVTLILSRQKPYQAYIKVNGKRIYLGYYSTSEAAARAYDAAALKYFGEFACLNFPDRLEVTQ